MLIKNSDLEKRIITFGLAIIFSLCATQMSLSASVSNDEGVNIRQEASVNSNVLGQLSKNQKVELLDVEGNWLKVSCDGIVGYVFNDYIDVEDNASVNGTDVNFRTKASTNSNIAKVSEINNRVSVIGKTNDFFEVIDDKNKYYVHDSLIKLDDNVDLPAILKRKFEKIENTTELIENAKIIGNDVNVRIEPSTTSDIALTLNYNDRVIALEKDSNWYKVQIDENEYYIYKDYVVILDDNILKIFNSINDDEVPETLDDKSTVYVNALTGLNLREEPNELGTKIMLMNYKSSCHVIEQLDNWYKVETKDGHIGYASAEFLTFNKDEVFYIPNKELRNQIVAFAEKYYGTKYVWGGNSLTDGIDCSGFTQQVFSNFGIQLDRSAKDQVDDGDPITKVELLPGDLVFFATMGGNSISHVALYIGDNKIIHATSSSNEIGVDISDLSENYYINTYRCATRVIK